ncbi:putative bifunctional diguanylate cyclase/phosphodiesterase [Krasilnikovia sp. MM14-A1259]|uniref:putative bifunctional diguanylate cyclase/phosphodiesterase n=1 Tax=Krasilnikovia sp. MM14-A1259 TaxID=3373539 RepID=UPI0038208887
MPTRLAATLFGVSMAVLGVAFWVEPAWHDPIRLAAGLATVAAVTFGVRRGRPARTVPWHLLSAVVLLSAVGKTVFDVPDAVQTVPYLAPVVTWSLLAVYPTLAGALLMFVHYRSDGSRDRGGLIDALTVTAGAALLSWTLVLSPLLRDADLTSMADLLAIGFPVGDLLLLAALTRLWTVSNRRVPSGFLLVFGALTMLLVDMAHSVPGMEHQLAALTAFGRLPLYAAIGLAALHGSMHALTQPAATPPADLDRKRLLLLGIAALVGPAVLLVQVGLKGRPLDLSVVAVLCGLTFMLVLARTAGIMGSQRLATSRERGLREASAVLVSASDADEVAEAARRAVAQLLPDVPHRVVLAMAVAQPEEPLSADAAAQAAQDRAAGTSARLVPTREVDWAVAVRLNQYNMVLRCPLVLQDRPTGDPLVGVLHVGAPVGALIGLQRSLEVLATQVALAMERIALGEEVIRRNSETYFRTLVQNTSDVIVIVDEEDRVRYASPSAQPVLGGDPVGVRLPDIIHPADRARLHDVLVAVRFGRGPEQGLDFRALGRNDNELMLEMHLRDLRADQTVTGLVITLRDVTERRRLERDLIHQAFHDSLTGLANRVLFADRLQHALARGARDGTLVGVLFIDLDDFKIVNDTLGHAVGDQLLIAVAQRISGALRAEDTAARLGGDEFAALIENVQDPAAVEEAAERILAALARPIDVDGEALQAVASIGITTTPEADNADELLRQADLALYVAKGAGKNQWRRYQAHLHGAMVERLELRSALDHAVNEGSFLLQYQPIVDLASDEAVGFEALVRWHHPSRGIIAPDQFIEVAEESGLIIPMGRWVLDQALHTVAQWRRVLPRTRQPYVSVNVSVRQFREKGFVDQVRASLQYAGVPPQALMLEITETLLMRDDEEIWADLAVLQDLGVRIAIDDFGTGYSSLGYLRQRPIDVLKIDKTFIDDMVGSEQQLALVSGIVSLAQSLNLIVVAEGIEDANHRDILQRLGCPLGQGYYYSSPVGPTEALTWLTASRAIAA